MIVIPTTKRNLPLLDRTFLHQKYITENLNSEQIAALTFSSRQTVKKYLLMHQIPFKLEDQPRKGPLPFGLKWSGNHIVPIEREVLAIGMMKELRQLGHSYQRIAECLNLSSISTQDGISKWYGQSVYRALSRRIQIATLK